MFHRRNILTYISLALLALHAISAIPIGGSERIARRGEEDGAIREDALWLYRIDEGEDEKPHDHH